MKLLQSIGLIIFLLSTTVACAQWKGKKIKGNGKITTQTISTTTYDGIKAAGSMDFNLVPGKEGNISIKSDSNLMEYIDIHVKNNQLFAQVKKGYTLKPSQTIVVTIPYESINTVSLSGSGDIENSGIIKSDELKVTLAGSGDIELNINTEFTESNIAGSGDIELEGTTNDLNVKITGSGDFDGDDLKSTNVTAQVTGSGSAHVVCSGELVAKVTGSGDVKYSGKPTNIDTKITGSGNVSN